MKKMMFAAALLLTAQVAQAGVFEFKSYSFANYGSPFTYVPTTADDLTSALNGGGIGGNWGGATLNELLQEGATSHSDEYDVGGGLHVSFSASAVYHPAEPLSTASPGIGAKVSAANNQNPGAATVIGEDFVYMKETLFVNNLTGLDQVIKKYDLTISLDGVVQVGGDAIALVGEAVRIGLDNGTTFTTSNMRTFQPGIGGLPSFFNFGTPGQTDPSITLTQAGLYGTQLIAREIRSMTFETLLYVRAQTGGLARGAGMASADFSNTLRVSNIRFFDENDQVIPGLQVVGSDGAVYPYNVVPEPSTLALFGVGFIGLFFCTNFRAAYWFVSYVRAHGRKGPRHEPLRQTCTPRLANPVCSLVVERPKAFDDCSVPAGWTRSTAPITNQRNWQLKCWSFLKPLARNGLPLIAVQNVESAKSSF